MKKSILIVSTFLAASLTYGQEEGGKEKKAKAAYEDFSYSKSIEKYEELGASTIEQKRNLANAYWRTNELAQAETIYAEIVTTDGFTADDLLSYASILRENKKYSMSDDWMKKFSEMNVSDSRGKMYAAKPGAYEQLQKDKGQFKIKNLDINSEQQDFGATYYKSQVVFASSREGTKSILRRWNWNGLPFLDTYVADIAAHDLTNLEHFHKKINKKYHEGPVAFNKAGDMMIFTRNNYKEKAEDGVTRLMMFQSKLVEGKWSKPVALPYNSPTHSVGHACISADGKTLYFASDMPGGKGGSDIYKAPINDDGSFGEAVNMGAEVNTEGNEMFPFIHPTNEMLFFSSNGHVGLGGLDVFVAQIKEDNSIGKILNAGAPLNSSRDDFSFVLAEDGKQGYFASNREGGKGDDDIYSLEMLKDFTFGKTIKGVAKDKKGNILAGVAVQLFDDAGEPVETVTTGDNGEYSFLVPADKDWSLGGEKEKYFPGKNTTSTATDEDVVIADLELEKDPGLSLYALVTDKETKEPIDSVHIKLTDNMTGVTEEFWTPVTGDLLKPLKEKKLNDRGSYNLVLERDGYLGKTVTYNTEFDKEGKYEVHAALDLTLEPIQVGGDLSKIIDINPIYFDLGKHKIRPDAAIELDKIVKVMNENPNMEIELGSHTDSRGSDKSNESLSDRRAKASAAYIKERITNPERINGKGYGEYKPNKIILEDGTEKVLLEDYINSFKSSNKKKYDELHQMNRRTEFIILKM
ncbi:MAG: OmpA family protein [Crocinitomicaceae bacterium]